MRDLTHSPLSRPALALALTAATASLLTPARAPAADLKAPYELENSQVLPAGVRSPRYKNLFMTVDARFNGDGVSEALGAPLNKGVTWADVLKTLDGADRALVAGSLQYQAANSPGGKYGAADSVGETRGQINTFADVKVPILAIGVTDRLSLAAVVPVYRVEIKADTGFVANPNVSEFIAATCARQPGNCDQVNAKFNEGLANAVNSELVRKGYQPIRSETLSGIGDVKLVGKYLAYQGARDALSLKGTLTLPTGEGPNADKVVDVPLGDGQTDFGVLAAYDRELGGDFFFNTYGSYNIQFGDSLDRRIPENALSPLSADKERVDRNMGDETMLGVMVNRWFPVAGLTFGAGYNIQHINATSFSGTRFAAERYQLLANEFPAQTLQSAVASAGFSTVEWYQNKEFFYPLRANVMYSHPVSGRNVTTNDVLMAELTVFF